jgi:hypothetical protein
MLLYWTGLLRYRKTNRRLDRAWLADRISDVINPRRMCSTALYGTFVAHGDERMMVTPGWREDG